MHADHSCQYVAEEKRTVATHNIIFSHLIETIIVAGILDNIVQSLNVSARNKSFATRKTFYSTIMLTLIEFPN